MIDQDKAVGDSPQNDFEYILGIDRLAFLLQRIPNASSQDQSGAPAEEEESKIAVANDASTAVEGGIDAIKE